jgi:hypothetical protein
MRAVRLVTFRVVVLSILWSTSCLALEVPRPDGMVSSSVAMVSSSSSESIPSEAATVVTPTASSPISPQASLRPFSAIGVGANFSSVGVGFEAATPLGWHTDLRAGFNVLGFGETFSSNGMNYSGTLSLRSFETLVDWFPFRNGFHISPGAMIYNGNQLKANVAVPGGASFSLNNTNYLSDPADPVTGTGSLKFSSAGPMLLAGWGNLLPRTKHFSIPFEAGAVFQGSPRTVLNLSGSVCTENGKHCGAISANSDAQADIQAQEVKFNKDASALRFYPVISLGLAYRFGR